MPIELRHIRFECIEPILRIESMATSLHFYVELLGFHNAPWGNDGFTRVERDGRGLFLSVGEQGRGGAWVWVGVGDVDQLHRDWAARGVRILVPPTNYPWAREMQVEDPDRNVLRVGSDLVTDDIEEEEDEPQAAEGGGAA